jgi:hypothetical protein
MKLSCCWSPEMGRNHKAWGVGTRTPQVIKILERQRRDSC